jgi:hypothetical protein
MKTGMIWLMILAWVGNLQGQTARQVQVESFLLTDTVRTGVPVVYALVARHPADTEVLFPDSAAFQPFLWQGYDFFPTRTRRNISTDSVVYRLVLFQPGSDLRLRLPVYLLNGSDCTAVFSAERKLFFKSSLPPNPLPVLRKDTDFLPVDTQEDDSQSWLRGIWTAGIAGLGWLLFGRRIRRIFRLYRLRLQNRRFQVGFDRLARRSETGVEVEKAVVLWKNYMEDLQAIPFSTYTTKEILEQLPDEALAGALQQIDRVIYGQLSPQSAVQALPVLEEVSRQVYRQQREALRQR